VVMTKPHPRTADSWRERERERGVRAGAAAARPTPIANWGLVTGRAAGGDADALRVKFALMRSCEPCVSERRAGMDGLAPALLLAGKRP
jgi:hypothetical protein